MDARRLFGLLYTQLHRLARRQLARNGRRVALGATTLLHESYLDMSQRESLTFSDVKTFMAYAAKVMRTIVVDHVRRRDAAKRGGGVTIMSLDSELTGHVAGAKELAAISDAIHDLATADAALADLVDLKFFQGFSFAEIAGMRNVSERTVLRQWEKARIHLHRSMQAA